MDVFYSMADFFNRGWTSLTYLTLVVLVFANLIL